MVKKHGVVIFNDDYFSHEGLAALKWAYNFLPKDHLVRILLVWEQSQPTGAENSKKKIEKTGVENRKKKIEKTGVENSKKKIEETGVENSKKEIEKTDYNQEQLFDLVKDKGDNTEFKKDWTRTFEGYVDKFKPKEGLARSYRGSNINEILEAAIQDFELDTLVLGMEAIGLTRTGLIDVLLKSQCSVVLAMIDDPNKPLKLKTTIEISEAEPVDAQNNTYQP